MCVCWGGGRWLLGAASGPPVARQWHASGTHLLCAMLTRVAPGCPLLPPQPAAQPSRALPPVLLPPPAPPLPAASGGVRRLRRSGRWTGCRLRW